MTFLQKISNSFWFPMALIDLLKLKIVGEKRFNKKMTSRQKARADKICKMLEPPDYLSHQHYK